MPPNGVSPRPIRGTTDTVPIGSVFPHHRLPGSGPVLPGAELIQSEFDQCIFTADPTDKYTIVTAATLADQIAAKIPRDVSNPLTNANTLGVTLRGVKKDSVLSVWFSFGVVARDNGAAVKFALAIDNGVDVLLVPAGSAAFVAFATQLVFSTTNAALLGSILTEGPNPYGVTQDVRVFPVAFSTDPNTADVFPATNQIALTVDELQATP